ncbi:MAG: cytochrome c5 family protein [Caulobacter sp.]|nr:cytochrome c5 family protein [Caulobacter sp.]
MRQILMLAAAAMCLAACNKAPEPLTPEQSAALAPADARLAGLYETSCKTCHTVAGTGAPLAGDRTAWAPRVKQGPAVLLEHTVQGYRAMPAGGQCSGCTAADYEAMIGFMSGGR